MTWCSASPHRTLELAGHFAASNLRPLKRQQAKTNGDVRQVAESGSHLIGGGKAYRGQIDPGKAPVARFRRWARHTLMLEVSARRSGTQGWAE